MSKLLRYQIGFTSQKLKYCRVSNKTRIRNYRKSSIWRRILISGLTTLLIMASLQTNLGGSTIQLLEDEVPVKVLTWLEIISLHHRAQGGTISYKPQRVMRQIGFDQLSIKVTREMECSNILTVEAQFVREGREHIVTKFQSIYFGLTKQEWGLGPQMVQHVGVILL